LPPRFCTELPLTAAADGVRIAIRLTPRASADRIEAIVPDAAGGPVLKVLVTAPPVDDRANDALLQLLAREWRLPRRDLALAAGAKSRSKAVLIRGEAAALLARLGPAFAALPRK
jgi:uncharacterized protein